MMKKIIINICLWLVFLVVYFLQLNFFSWFRIAGVMPNLFIILILYIGLFMGKSMGLVYGVLYGLFLDLIIGKRIGISSITLAGIGIAGGIFDKNFSKDSRIIIMAMVAIATMIYEAGNYFLGIIILKNSIEIIEFLKLVLIETIYNVLITIILYPIMQSTGYNVEDEFKESKILTRYF